MRIKGKQGLHNKGPHMSLFALYPASNEKPLKIVKQWNDTLL